MEARVLGAGDEGLLAEAAAIGEGEDAPDRERCGQLLADPCFVAVVALEGGRAVGFAYGHVLPQMSRTGLLIYSIDTDEHYRRRGAARAMVEAMRNLSTERGYYEMWVLTNASNEPAMRLYEASGGVRETHDDVMWVFPTRTAPSAT